MLHFSEPCLTLAEGDRLILTPQSALAFEKAPSQRHIFYRSPTRLQSTVLMLSQMLGGYPHRNL
ncbi:MAG: hypothetical protein KME27_03255 [Lyngbya sp. HA4199-MV5]|nr:hypothetical protein [Lyngbya sp. HA4199-MV5]